MSTYIEALRPGAPRPGPLEGLLRASGLERLARGRLCRLLEPLEHGSLHVRFPDGEERTFGSGAPAHELDIRSSRFYRRLALSGGLGFAESYMRGEWETDDLPGLLRLLASNRDRLGDLEVSTAGLRNLLARALHRRRANTEAGSRRNVRDHYDLGNDLFAAFLDSSMTYSCALFESDDDSLALAQQRKLDRIIDRVGLEPHHHVLEIGCGWGSFALRAVERVGCRLTCLTLSASQKRWFESRVEENGLGDNIDVRLLDYRRATGSYDRIVSIEMLEAVGEEHLPSFFRVCETLLRPGGRMAIQVITIADDLYDAYRRRADFIQTHVFPGGHLPSLGMLRRLIPASTDLRVVEVAEIGTSYARTLAEWRRAFVDSAREIRALGYPPEFLRKWLYYFSYCEAGFHTGALDDVQIVLEAPGTRAGAPRL